MKKVVNSGSTLEKCYKNKPFNYPSSFCKRSCDDGEKFDFVYYPTFTRYAKFEDITNLFKTKEKISVMAIIKVDNAFNYYSPFKPKLV